MILEQLYLETLARTSYLNVVNPHDLGLLGTTTRTSLRLSRGRLDNGGGYGQ